jgi:thiaminase
MTDPTGTSAVELVTQTQSELAEMAEVIRSHRFLERLRTRDVPEARLRAFAGEQHAIVSSDRRSFAQLAARFPAGMAGAFFLGMAEGEGVALDKLRGLCDWLGMTEAELRGYEPHPGAQAYPAFVAWLALNGSRADVVLAFLANLAIWGENCAKVAADQPEVGRYVVQRRRGIATRPREVHRARDLPVHRLGQLDIPPRGCISRAMPDHQDAEGSGPRRARASRRRRGTSSPRVPLCTGCGNEPRPLARRCGTGVWFPWLAGRCTIAVPRRG